MRHFVLMALSATVWSVTPGPDVDGLDLEVWDPIDAEVIGTISGAGVQIDLVEGSALRIAGDEPATVLEELRRALGSDPYLVDEIMELLDGHDPSQLPDDTVLVVGIAANSCLPPLEVGLARDPFGDIVLTAELDPDEPTVECEVQQRTVAVIAANGDAVPPGSTDGADLVDFVLLHGPVEGLADALELDGVTDWDALAQLMPPIMSYRPNLPSLAPGSRRFAFRLEGCDVLTAELIVTATTVDVRAVEAPRPENTLCRDASYLAVFDTFLVPDNVELAARLAS